MEMWPIGIKYFLIQYKNELNKDLLLNVDHLLAVNFLEIIVLLILGAFNIKWLCQSNIMGFSYFKIYHQSSNEKNI